MLAELPDGPFAQAKQLLSRPFQSSFSRKSLSRLAVSSSEWEATNTEAFKRG